MLVSRKITLSALFVAIGLATAHIIYIPVGVAKCFPVQHALNVLGGVTLGPRWNLAIAFCLSILRNFFATGSLLAFPGSMFGAFLAGVLYKRYQSIYLAILGELIGTGFFGALAAFPIAKLVFGKDVVAWFFVLPFALSSIGGCILAWAIFKSGILARFVLRKKGKQGGF